MNEKTGKILITIIIVETILLGWLFFDRFSQKKENKQLTTELVDTNAEKQKVESELKEMLRQYEDLKSNDEKLNAKLEEEQKKIETLIAKLKAVKKNERYKITQLNKEIETLKKIMKSYIAQIDSLATENKDLKAENLKVKRKYENSEEKNKELENSRDSLKNKVKQAATLKTYDIIATPLNKWGKKAKKASWARKIKISFHIAENEIAKSGTRDIYIRISDANGKILTNSESTMFEYQGQNIAYSLKRRFEYTGADLDIAMFWNGEGKELSKGNYNVDIFTDGKIIGRTNFYFKK